jgi:hypothetical protein
MKNQLPLAQNHHRAIAIGNNEGVGFDAESSRFHGRK